MIRSNPPDMKIQFQAVMNQMLVQQELAATMQQEQAAANRLEFTKVLNELQGATARLPHQPQQPEQINLPAQFNSDFQKVLIELTSSHRVEMREMRMIHKEEQETQRIKDEQARIEARLLREDGVRQFDKIFDILMQQRRRGVIDDVPMLQQQHQQQQHHPHAAARDEQRLDAIEEQNRQAQAAQSQQIAHLLKVVAAQSVQIKQFMSNPITRKVKISPMDLEEDEDEGEDEDDLPPPLEEVGEEEDEVLRVQIVQKTTTSTTPTTLKFLGPPVVAVDQPHPQQQQPQPQPEPIQQPSQQPIQQQPHPEPHPEPPPQQLTATTWAALAEEIYATRTNSQASNLEQVKLIISKNSTFFAPITTSCPNFAHILSHALVIRFGFSVKDVDWTKTIDEWDEADCKKVGSSVGTFLRNVQSGEAAMAAWKAHYTQLGVLCEVVEDDGFEAFGLVIFNNLLRDSMYGMIFRISVGALLSTIDATTDIGILWSYFSAGLYYEGYLLLAMLTCNMAIQLLFVLIQVSEQAEERGGGMVQLKTIFHSLHSTPLHSTPQSTVRNKRQKKTGPRTPYHAFHAPSHRGRISNFREPRG